MAQNEQDGALYCVVSLALRRVDLATSPGVLHLDCSSEQMRHTNQMPRRHALKNRLPTTPRTGLVGKHPFRSFCSRFRLKMGQLPTTPHAQTSYLWWVTGGMHARGDDDPTHQRRKAKVSGHRVNDVPRLHNAEDRGFEPLRALTQHAFQACAIGR